MKIYWILRVHQDRIQRFSKTSFKKWRTFNLYRYFFILDGINLFYALYQVYPNLRDDIAKQFRKILKEEGEIYLKEPQK